MRKRILRPLRIRQIPQHFTWVDHRLVGEKRLRGCDSNALALYLFLLIAGDAQGVSYYSDQSITYHLPMDFQALQCARENLQRHDLIAYEHPFYQILELSRQDEESKRYAKSMSAGEIFSQIMKGGSDD